MTTTAHRSPAAGATAALDGSQASVRDAVLAGGHHVVHGAPGSGKTLTAVETFCEWLTEEPGSRAVLLVPTRRRAAVLRDEVARRLGRTGSSVLVRTPASLAFAVLRLRASHLGQPAPTLITGPEQDQVLAELLAGHAAGEGTTIDWPASIPPATRTLRAFRDELRDLVMRAAEAGLDGTDLTRWGEVHGRPEWCAAGRLLTEYTNVTLLGETTPDRGARYDAATIVDEAVLALRTWEQVLPGVPRPGWDLVVHDDYQDATLATARLLDALADDGARLALLGDPDTAVQSFRGGVPALLHMATLPPGQAGSWGAEAHVLERVWRHGGAIREVVGTLSRTLPSLQETRRRRAVARQDGRPAIVRTAVVASQAQEVALIARTLREHHVRAGMPWSRMAVIVRSGADIGSVRRGLRTAGVPLTMAAADRPLRDEPAVRPLLLALRAVLAGRVEPETGSDLLLSPLGGLDAVSLRSLRRVLRQAERADGGDRHSDDLLARVLTDPAAAAELPPRHRRAPQAVARVLDAGRTALAQEAASTETVLWAIWEAAGLSEPWQRRALAGGPGADRADADLDAVTALFRAAEQFVDRTPRSTPAGFLEHLDAQDFPADTLAARGQVEQAVEVHTPASAAGEEWDLVVVSGVQEDTWPDLRIRDTLLGAADLADIATARHVELSRPAAEVDRYRRARREVFDGELRTFVTACSRARRELLVTAVLDADSRPSVFFTDLSGDDAELRLTTVPAPLDLRGLVGELRAALRPVLGRDAAPGAADVARASDAAAVLAHLAARGVEGADPVTWGVLTGPSSSAPLWGPGQTVSVTPSTVETLTTCPLRWALTASGGRPSDSASQNLGNLLHEIAAEHPHGTEPELLAALDARWHELDAPDGWIGRRERARAERMLGKLAAYHASHPGPVRTEVEFSAALGRVELRGRVDRVEETSDGALRVVDLKTGSSAVTKEEARRHPQLGAYQAAVSRGAFDAGFDGPGPGRSGGAALLYIGTPAKGSVQRDQVPLGDDEDPAWAERLLDESAETMAAAQFQARPGTACRTCAVRTSCPAQADGLRVVPDDR